MRGLGGLGFKRAAETFWTWYIKCVCTSNAQYPNILTDLCNNILLNSSKIQIAANEVLEHLFIGIPIPCCCCYRARASLDCGYDEFNLRCITRWVVITSQCLLPISFMHFIDVTKALCRLSRPQCMLCGAQLKMAPQAKLFDNHQCRGGYRGRHAFRDLNLRSANKIILIFIFI